MGHPIYGARGHVASFLSRCVALRSQDRVLPDSVEVVLAHSDALAQRNSDYQSNIDFDTHVLSVIDSFDVLDSFANAHT